MRTYTIAYLDGMLLATVPDGTPREQTLAMIARDAGEAFVESAVYWEDGLTLTDDEPDDDALIAWAGDWGIGFILDEDRRDWAYAVRPAPAPAEPEPRLCLGCSGSGEGAHEGTRCWTCGGKGEH